jgi:chitinase
MFFNTGEAMSDKIILGYYPQWLVEEGKYSVKMLDESGAAAHLTHINYAFGNVSKDLKAYVEQRAGWGHAWADYQMPISAADSIDGLADSDSQALRGNFNQLKKLKAKHPHLKILISMGGWIWSGLFSDAALAQNRAAFVKSTIDLYIHGNLEVLPNSNAGGPSVAAGIFDGIDIDWEFPGADGYMGDSANGVPPNIVRPEDTQNFTALLAEFRKQLDDLSQKTGVYYPLTIATSAVKTQYKMLELDKIGAILDWINVMCYDMHGGWDVHGPTNFHAPLYSSDNDPSTLKTSCDQTMNDYLKGGVPADKLVMGIPFYGRGWTGVPDQNHGLYQVADSITPVEGQGGLGHFDMLDKLEWLSYRDPKTQGFWKFDGNTFWAYDDIETVYMKMNYIKQMGFKGGMFWALGGDGPNAPLVKAMHDGLK